MFKAFPHGGALAACLAMILFTLPDAAFGKGGDQDGGPAGPGNARHTTESATTTVTALMGSEAATADSSMIKERARAWCQTKVRGGGRITRIELLTGGKVRCWHKG